MVLFKKFETKNKRERENQIDKSLGVEQKDSQKLLDHWDSSFLFGAVFSEFVDLAVAQ